MDRTSAELEEELLRIWTLVGELSEQLSSNRALAAQLKARSENVKGQAAHVGTGFPLRRFNLDLSDEEFQTELEGFASHLVLENQQLQHENKQLNTLLKEYEQTLETVMGKFRGVAHASQQHDLSLHSYYTSLLQTLQTAHSSAQLHDNTSLSLLLTRLSTLLRSALRSMGGEEVNDFDLASQLPGLLYLADSNSLENHLSDPSTSSSSSSPTRSNFSGGKALPRAPARPRPFPGSLPGASGGYAGTEGQADWALEREMEIRRLEEENQALRELLAIAEDAAVSQGAEDDLVAKKSPDHAESIRKNSLTIEELEADAEREEEAEKIRNDDERLRSGDVVQTFEPGPLSPRNEFRRDLSPPKPGITALRPLMNESVLGFQPQTPPPEEAIDDSDL